MTIELWEYWWPDRGDTIEDAQGVHADQAEHRALVAERIAAYELAHGTTPRNDATEHLAMRSESSGTLQVFLVSWKDTGFSVTADNTNVSTPFALKPIHIALAPLTAELERMRQRVDAVRVDRDQQARIARDAKSLAGELRRAMERVLTVLPLCGSCGKSTCPTCLVNTALDKATSL